MFDQQDISTLEIFAYNRIAVRRFAEALPVYELLSELENKKQSWQLAAILCLWHLGARASAHAKLETLEPQRFTQEEKSFFSRLSQLVQS